jgi:hypothetical protein
MRRKINYVAVRPNGEKSYHSSEIAAKRAAGKTATIIKCSYISIREYVKKTYPDDNGAHYARLLKVPRVGLIKPDYVLRTYSVWSQEQLALIERLSHRVNELLLLK